MAVIINEFDFVMEEQADVTPEPEAQQGAPTAPQPTMVKDIHDIIDQQAGRMARVWAH